MKQPFKIDAHILAMLPTLQAVAEAGSFSSAASRLGISPSAVSQAIRQLEARLGQRLFNRTSRSVTLTENGRRFVDDVSPGLERLGMAVADMQATAAKPAGTLRINLSRLAADVFVLPKMHTFVVAHPDIVLELFVDDRLTDVVGAGFDAGIRSEAALEPGMISVPLHPPLRRSILASPTYLDLHGVPAHPKDLLTGHRAIRFRYPGNGRLEPWRFRDGDHEFALDPTSTLILTDNEHIRRATLAGLGIAQRFLHTEETYVKTGELLVLLERFDPPPDRFHLYYPSRRLLPPKLRSFIDHLART